MVDEDPLPELSTFSCPEAYVYAPLPPASSYGHRAELWNVEKWLKAVKLRVVSRKDDLFVRLEDQDTGELFAEAPLPNDGTPLTTVLEPVVDSSRYYVLRIQDRDHAERHAFIGLGFRDRYESSEFSAALDEYRQYLRRKREAAAMRQDFEQREVSEQAARPAQDLSLKPGQTIKLNLIQKNRATGIAAAVPGPSSSSVLSRSVSLSMPSTSPTAGGLKLPPPPPPGAKVSMGPVSGGDAELAGGAMGPGAPSTEAGKSLDAANDGSNNADDEDFGEFVG